MKNYLAVLMLGLASIFAQAKTVTSVAVSPQGAVIQSGSTFQYSAVCTYDDSSTDNCTAAGGVTWSTSSTINHYLSVSAGGLVTANTDPATVANPFGGFDTNLTAYAIATIGSLHDRALTYIQHPGDTWYQYPTPDLNNYYTDSQPTPVFLGMNVTVGSTVTIGSGFIIGYNGPATGQGQYPCTWTSSDTTKATVDKQGLVTAIAPGSVTITCPRYGDGVFGNSADNGWISPGNVITLTIVNGGTSNQTWYVRPNGGTLYTNSTDTPTGQCSGKVNADYPGSGVNQPCAVANLYDLWLDGQPFYTKSWAISGGDTVILAQNSAGYYSGGSSFTSVNGVSTWTPMPTIPSGTAARHTRILGENFASCSSNSAKTLMTTGWGAQTAFNVKDSQYVDIACFEVTDKAACAASGSFATHCTDSDNYGNAAIYQSALTASVNYTDLYIHGLATQAIFGATGVGVVGNRIYIRGMPSAGINMDDASWNNGNVSVAGGFTLNNSVTEFTGCVEEYPVVHNYPYIECRDSNTGAYGDGFGTAAATGDWSFDNDIWRYNFQDGLDLLHSGLNSLIVTHSQSYGNDGQQYKIGSGKNVVFRNNAMLGNCQRINQVIGDEPLSAVTQSPQVTFTTSGLNFTISAGNVTISPGVAVHYAGGTFLLTANSETSFWFDASGAVQSSTTGYPSPTPIGRQIAHPDTNGTSITSINNDNPQVALCRAGGDSVPISFDAQGSDWFQGNTFAGYGPVMFDVGCNYDTCTTTDSQFEDNIVLGLWSTTQSDSPETFMFSNYTLPANDGWAVRDHNLFWNLKNSGDFVGGCPGTLLTGEVCADPSFVNEPALKVTDETTLDNFNFKLSDSSTAIAAGIAISGITTDNEGNAYLSTPSIGAVQFSLSPVASVALTITPSTFAVDGNATLACTATLDDSTTRPCASPTYTDNTSSVATLSGTTLTGVAAGTGSISVSDEGFSSSNVAFTVTPKPVLVFIGGSLPHAGGTLQ